MNTAAAHTGHLLHTEERHPKADTYELGDNGQRVQDEQVDRTERTPKLVEAIDDQSGVTDTRHGPQTQHHFLVDVQHRDKQYSSMVP